MNDQLGYFPVSLGSRSHDFWRLWCLSFPEARVWPAEEKDRVYSADTLPQCSQVVVGIPGIPADVGLDWTFNRHQPSGPQVREVLERAKRSERG